MSRMYVLPFLTAIACLVATYVAAREKVYFPDLEHLNVTYWNPKYYSFMNYSARRYSRSDPTHYVNLHYEALASLGNDFLIDVYIYEFLSNEYRRSFVEMHFKLCDLMFTDTKFGAVFAEKLPEINRSCPFPKGIYRLENVSFPDLPVLRTFPFQKGRIFVNTSLPKTSERMVEAYIDLVIKTKWR